MLWPADMMREIDKIRKEMDDLLARTSLYVRGVNQYPLINLYDLQNEIILIAEIPGIDKNKLEVQFNNGMLTLSGKRELKRFGKLNELRLEQPEGNFEKNIRIPVKIKDSEIKAKYEDGILTMTLPKSEEAKPRQILIGNS